MTDMHQLAGAYVLNALNDDEREAFEAYMATSPATQAEVESLREVSALLGAAAAETPPAGLRRAVMRDVDATRQLPPVLAAPEISSAAITADTTADATSNTTAERTAGQVVALDAVRARRLSRMTQAVGAVAAAAVVIALGLAGVASNLSNRLDDVERTAAQVAMLAAAPDAARYTTAYPTGGSVTAMISADHGAFAVAEGLPELTDDQIYALWGLTAEGPVPIGALHNGQALAITLDGIDGLGLTIEPDGPLSVPTGAVEATLGA